MDKRRRHKRLQSTNLQKMRGLPRQADALELRSKGFTYDGIAFELGYDSGSGAYAAVQAALDHAIIEPGLEQIKIELGRLDRWLTQIEKKWDETGDQCWAELRLKIQAQRAKYLGLMSDRSEVRHSGAIEIKLSEVSDAELDSRLAIAFARTKVESPADSGREIASSGNSTVNGKSP